MARIRNFSQSIYVMVAPTGECKIGIAIDPDVRLSSIKYAMPRGVVRLAFQSAPHEDMWRVEQHMHAKLHPDRLNGEWFDVDEMTAVSMVQDALMIEFSALDIPIKRAVTKRKRRRARSKQAVATGRRKVILSPGQKPIIPATQQRKRVFRARVAAKTGKV